MSSPPQRRWRFRLLSYDEREHYGLWLDFTCVANYCRGCTSLMWTFEYKTKAKVLIRFIVTETEQLPRNVCVCVKHKRMSVYEDLPHHGFNFCGLIY